MSRLGRLKYKTKRRNKLNIKKWAEKQKIQIIKDIKFYIAEGFKKNQATEIVLKDSTVGAGIKAQIRYEVKSL